MISPNQNKPFRFKGTSLIEIIVAVAILGGTLAVYGTLLNILRLNKSGALETLAYKLAQEELEAVRAIPLAELSTRTNANFTNIFYHRGTYGAKDDASSPSLPNNLELKASSTLQGAIVLPFNNMADLTIEANIKSSSLTDGAGFILRARDIDNYYFFYLAANRLVLEKKVGGATTVLYENLQTFNNNVWYKLKAAASGSLLSLYLNDLLLTTVTDGTLTSGFAALASYNLSINFDNVSLIYNLGNYLWNFDDLASGTLPSDWRRTGLGDLPSGAGALSISEPYGDPKIKKIDVTVSWQERGQTKSVTLGTMKTE